MEFVPAIVDKLRQHAARYRELCEQISDPNVAASNSLPELLKEQGRLSTAVQLAERLEAALRQRAEATELLADPDADPDLKGLAREELEELEELEAQLDTEIKAELVNDTDLQRSKIIIEIRAGTGGDEATLFARDLHELYRRFIDHQKGWKVEVIDATTSEVGGFREIVLGVQGEGAWRLFRFESGGHRVQRVPATESQGRIHTSAATVAVLPEAEAVDVEIKPEDLRIDTMRAGGAGGQHVNKVETAVRITHLPTSLAVVCQEEKSQRRNKEKAMRLLRTRLFDMERQRLHAERAAERKSQVGSGDRSERVRTYNYPQNRVTDHRLGENVSLEQVLAGRLTPLLSALDELDREERIRNL